jgi:hypothetical protein
MQHLDGSCVCHAEWTRPISKNLILCDSIYTTDSRGENDREGGQVSGCQSLRWGEERGEYCTIKEQPEGDLCSDVTEG